MTITMFILATIAISAPIPTRPATTPPQPGTLQPRETTSNPALQGQGPPPGEVSPNETSPPAEAAPGESSTPTSGASKPAAGTSSPEALTPTSLKPRLDHAHQGGIEVGIGWGYRVIKPYGDIWCGSRSHDDSSPNDPFCHSAIPLYLDIGGSYGINKTVDVVAHFRYGLLKDSISNHRPLTLLAGVRLWIDSVGNFKFGVGFEAMFDFTKQDGYKQLRPGYGAPKHDAFDVGGRVYGQVQYDFLRYVGLYAQFGGLLGALRWIRLEMEGALGIQARFP
ncbi:MAG: hypothetical protein J7M25_13885 [Deltaproteobacteria bacterium]|nr:hypothetical protein [Deltaproteobacteria bacterium]